MRKISGPLRKEAIKQFDLEVMKVDTGGDGVAHVAVKGCIGSGDIDDMRNFVRGYSQTFGCPRPTIVFTRCGRE